MDDQERLELARQIRDACVTAALEAYEDAGAQGLCGEGRSEAAISALQRIDLGQLVSKLAEEYAPEARD